MQAGSVGVVTPQQFVCDAGITLACGKSLPQYTLVYETYGELNADASGPACPSKTA